MGLSDDQRALLRLLAQREEGYDDIAALMGLSVDEVRARVKGALEELDEEGVAAGPVAAGDPPPPAVAKASSGAAPPAAPPAEERPAPTPVSRPAQPKPRRQTATQMGRRRLWELVGGALVVLLLVLFATGAIDIGGDDSGDDSDTPALSTEPVGAEGKITQAALEPVDGGDARGRALFGRLKKEIVLQVVADGLEPSGSGESYTVWLYRSPKLALRVGAVQVGDTGELAARFPVPAELLALVANRSFKQINLTLTDDAAYEAEIAAAKQQQRLPRYTGETILSGDITGPIAEVGAAGG